MSRQSLLGRTLAACRTGFRSVALYSFFLNLLMLTAPLYMLQVFDRVITARSTETLIFLSLIALVALATLAVLEIVRGRTMIKLGSWLDRTLSGPVLGASIAGAAESAHAPSIQGLRDISTLRNFLTGPAVFPILDAPWTPIFVAVIFILHPLLGLLAVGGAVVLFALAVANDLAARRLLEESGAASIRALRQAEAAARNADVIMAMGLKGNLLGRWRHDNDKVLGLLASASARSGMLTAASKFLRMVLQIGTLGLGAWLVLENSLTAGGMIAASILLGRALAPVDQAITSWKTAVGARTAYRRIKALLASVPSNDKAMKLPVPQGALEIEGLAYVAPGAAQPLLRGLNLSLEPGESLGVIGPTAAGKTTFARLIVGTRAPMAGHVRLDGADVAQWDSDDRGKHIGYLPQDVELFGATVKENIAHMGEADAEAVVRAARLAGVHDLILRLPQGYETPIGEGGGALSGGQRQRIALARAVFGDPRLVVLDEPNANLDHQGEAALVETMLGLRRRAVTSVVIAHRPSILRNVDKILVLREGAAPMIGPRDEILAQLTGPAVASAANSEQKAEGDGELEWA